MTSPETTTSERKKARKETTVKTAVMFFELFYGEGGGDVV